MPIGDSAPLTSLYPLQRPQSNQFAQETQELSEELFLTDVQRDFREAFPTQESQAALFADQNQVRSFPEYGPSLPEYDFVEEPFEFDFSQRSERDENDQQYGIGQQRNTVNNNPYAQAFGGPSLYNNPVLNPQYSYEEESYQPRMTRREVIDGLRSGLRDSFGEGGATAIEATLGLAHIATGGKVKHSFDTSSFIPRSRLSIAASIEGEAKLQFRVPLGGY